MQKSVFLKCKKNLKKFFICTLFLALVNSAFAGTGALFGKKNLRVTKTQWFDIIYPPESQGTASIFYENADTIYNQVTAQYNTVPWFRMPIVIVPTVDSMNAFWTIAPYNHIVIYDTSISKIDELATYSETVLSVFRHELTHAVTNNMKGGFWKGVSKIFGDPVTPGMLAVSSGIAEGATLTSESANGEGRLNDEYSKQVVKQAKLEHKFPSYYDVKGASDKYPFGSAYYFNGAFHQWLQDKYGMDSYAKFWFNIVNTKKIFINSCFKDAFGTGIKAAWKQFYNEYEVPEIYSDPLSESNVYDFFIPDSQKKSHYNKLNKRYSSLTISKDSLFWIEETGSKIQYVNLESFNDEKIKPETLFSFTGITCIKVSEDGRFLAISYSSQNAPGETYCVKIYDLVSKQFYSVPETSLKNPAIIQSDDDYYLIANKYSSPKNSVVISKIIITNEKITGLQEFCRTEQSVNEYTLEYTQFGNGQFACIKKNGLNYSICIKNIKSDEKSEFTEISAPKDRMVISSLSANGQKLYFSWTEPGSMPRLGILDLKDQIMKLSCSDLSGGIYEPVAIQKTSEITYTGHFYSENRLFRTQESEISDFETFEVQYEKKAIASVEQESGENTAFSDLEFVKYNPFNYMKRGIFAPVSIYQTEYFGCNSAYSSDTATYLLGATYVTSNPWSDGDNDLFIITGGWNYLNNSFGIDLQAKIGAETRLLNSTIDLKNEFNDKGWKFSAGKLNIQSTVSFGRISYLTLTNETAIMIGHQDKRIYNLSLLDEFRFWNSEYFKCCSSDDDVIYSCISELLTIGYANIHKSGASRFEKIGIGAYLSFDFRKDNALSSSPVTYTDSFNIYPSFKAYTPWFIPTKYTLSILPIGSNYGYDTDPAAAGHSIFDFKTESVLFSVEPQKALPFISALFINDIYISAGYSGTLGAANMSKLGFQLPYLADYLKGTFNGEACYLDAVYLKATVEFSPNIGLLANPSFKTNLFGMISYSLHKTKVSNIPIAVHVGMKSTF